MKLSDILNEAGIVDKFRARSEERKARAARDKASDAWFDKASQYDWADEAREPHEQSFMDYMSKAREHEQSAEHLRKKKGFMDKARRRFNKAMTWEYSDPKEMMARVQEMDDETLLNFFREIDNSGDGSAAHAQQKMIRRELRRRGYRDFDKRVQQD